jgi:hypothetical protein
MFAMQEYGRPQHPGWPRDAKKKVVEKRDGVVGARGRNSRQDRPSHTYEVEWELPSESRRPS